jgi:V8-like Glu-specific endopeptidase
MFRAYARFAVAALFPLTAVGCLAQADESTAGDTPEEDVGEAHAAIINGTVTSARPEIGKFFLNGGFTCTATLIAPHYALMAAHCYGGGSVGPNDFVRFDSSSTNFFVQRAHFFGQLNQSLGGSMYDADMVLLQLATDVPPGVATPVEIAEVLPDQSSVSTTVGYGCNNPANPSSAGVKRFSTYVGLYSNFLCPGDSGGPTLYGNIGDDGPLWGVSSGMSTWNINGGWQDVRADATYAKKQIVGLMQAWDGEITDGMDRYGSDSGPPINASTVSQCRDACVATGPACRAWSFVKPGVWDANGYCFRKSGPGEFIPNAGVASGLNPNRPGFQAETNVNRPGATYQWFTLSSGVNQCAIACAQDWRCRAFVVDGNASPQVCYLQGGVPAPVGWTGASSAVKGGLEMETDRAGSDYRSFTISSTMPEMCQSQCALENACVAWTYVPPASGTSAATCWLKNGIPAPTPAAGIISGKKWNEYY